MVYDGRVLLQIPTLVNKNMIMSGLLGLDTSLHISLEEIVPAVHDMLLNIFGSGCSGVGVSV